MLHRIGTPIAALVLFLLLNSSLDWAWLSQLAGYSVNYWGSLSMLAIAMLTVIPALLTLGTGPIELLSAASFIMFFWGRYQVTHDPVPLLIFAFGLFFLAVEVLATPGLGKPFLLGAVAMSAAIWLAYPNAGEAVRALLVAGSALALGLALSLRFLPRHRLLALPPPSADASRFDPAAELRRYVGCQGRAVTVLKPSGKIQLGNQELGARAPEGFVAAGAAVRVIDVEHNQLLVEPC